MSKPKRTRAERERINRQFSEWLLLPAIGEAVRRAGLRGDAAFSAALSELQTIKELRHICPVLNMRRRTP